MVYTLIHLTLYNSDWCNGDDTWASPIVRLVSSPPDQLLHSSSSVFSQKGKGVYTWARSGGSKEVLGHHWVNHSLLLPISTFPPQLQTMVQTPAWKSLQLAPLELKHQSYVHQFSPSTLTHSLYSLPHHELTHLFGVTTLCPQDCYIAAEWQVMATTYNGENDILTSPTTRNEKNWTWTFLGFLCHLLCRRTSSRPLHCNWAMCRNYKLWWGGNLLTSLIISQEPNLTISRLSFQLATNPLTAVCPQVPTNPGDYI